MSEVASKATTAKEALQTVLDLRKKEIEERCEQLKRIKTPSDEATATAAAEAAEEAQSYIDSVLG